MYTAYAILVIHTRTIELMHIYTIGAMDLEFVRG